MQSVQASADDPVGDGDSAPTYRVRFWTPAPRPRSAWMVDEYDVTKAKDVAEVIEWATATAVGNPFEVFHRWDDHHTDRNSETIPRHRYTLLYGKPAGEEVTTESIIFTSD